MQVGDVEAADLGALRDVAGVAADPLVAARAEGERTLAGEHDHADRGVLARLLERVGDLDDRLRPERVADLGPVDRDLGDAVARRLVADVLVLGGCGPGDGQGQEASLRAMEPWLERAAALRPNRTAVEADDGTRTYAELLDRARAWPARWMCGPATAWRSRCRPASRFAEVLHGCLLAGAAAMPVDLRLAAREREAIARSAAAVVDESWAGEEAPGTRVERRPHDRRCRARRPHLGHDRRAARRRALVRQRAGAGARLGRRARPRPGRALAVPAAALARRRPDGPAALGDLRDDGDHRSASAA